VSKSTAWFTIKKVRAIYNIRNQFIKCSTYEETENTWTNIQLLYRFSKVLDINDGTHINISRPKKDANNYVNRKGRFSVQLQVKRIKMLFIIFLYQEIINIFYRI